MFPVDMAVGPVASMTPPPRAKSPIEPSPLVVKTFVLLSVASDPAPLTNTPAAMRPVVVTEPPFSVTSPPVSACTPGAKTPWVTIDAPSAVIVDPPPEA